AFAEREGTFTNAERRVQHFLQARRPEGDAPPDWLVFQDLARTVQSFMPSKPALVEPKRNAKTRSGATTAVAIAAPPTTVQQAQGAAWDYVVASDIAEEIGRTVRGYSKATYSSLELTRKSWGRQSNEAFYYDGTSYENSEGVGVQIPATAEDPKSTFAISLPAPVAPSLGEDRFPLTLLTPTRAYDGGEWMRGSKLLNRVAPSHAILSMADAQRLGVGMGEKVRLESAAGALELQATIDAGLNAGLVLAPDVAGTALASILTGPQTRVNVTKIEN
ncbi:MAG: molybdopterin dinucleotide binding domain-containing protein, partial [Roseiflexaceae bacterium]